jgi:hypothetical protein
MHLSSIKVINHYAVAEKVKKWQTEWQIFQHPKQTRLIIDLEQVGISKNWRKK